VFASPLFTTVSRCDQPYQVMATVVMPDLAPPPPHPPPPPPVASEPIRRLAWAVVRQIPPVPGDPPVAPEWGAGTYPPADPDNNDIHLDAIGFTAKNLTILSVQTSGLGVSFSDPFVCVPDTDPNPDLLWVAQIGDGDELPSEASTLVTYRLHTVEMPFFDESCYRFPAPGTAAGTLSEVVMGLYYHEVTATEPNGDSARSLSETLGVEFLTPIGFDLFGPRSGRLRVRVGTAGSPPELPVGEAKYAYRKPFAEQLTVLAGTSPAVSGLISEELIDPYTFDLAGVYYVAATYRDTQARVHDAAATRWAPAAGDMLYVPAATHIRGQFNMDPAVLGRLSYAYEQVGNVAPIEPGGPHTFYSAVFPQTTRGGVVPNGNNTVVLQAMEDDQIVDICCHAGRLENVPGMPDMGYLELEEGVPLIASTIMHTISSSSARLVWVAACRSWDPFTAGDTSSICGAIWAKGPNAVVGYTGSPSQYRSCQMERKAWERLAQNAATVSQAVDDALAWAKGQWWYNNGLELDTIVYDGGGTRIAPAIDFGL